MTNNMFDDLVLKAKDLADAAGKKTADIYEISKYKYECIRLNGEVKKLYEQLGSSVYSQRKGGYDNEALADSLSEEIDEKLARLKELDALILDKRNILVCPVCGAKNAGETCYCSRCGTKLREKDDAEPDLYTEPDEDGGED